MEREAQIQGDLGEMPLSDLLRWMGWSRRSGLLELRQAAERYELRFVRGRLTEGRRFAGSASRVELDRGIEPQELERLLRDPLQWTEGRFLLHETEPSAAPAAGEEAAAAWEAPSVAALESRVAERLLSGTHPLAALSETALKILRMSRDPRTTLRQLAEVILADPALTQAILRYANSASDGPRQAIDSLPMALARVGFRTVRPLALAVCLYSAETRSAALRDVRLQLWRHALSVALLARHLATRVKLDEEEVFLCGLLHDLGKAMILSVLDELIAEGQTVLPGREGLEALLVRLHCRLHRPLPTSWELPVSVEHAVEFHHAPERAPASSARTVAAVALANVLINALERDGALPDSVELALGPACVRLGLGERQLEHLAASAMEFFEQGQNFIRS